MRPGMFCNLSYYEPWIIIIPFFTGHELTIAFKSNQLVDLILHCYLLKYYFWVSNMKATLCGADLKGFGVSTLRPLQEMGSKVREAVTDNLSRRHGSQSISRAYLLMNLSACGSTCLWGIMASPFSKPQWVTGDNWETWREEASRKYSFQLSLYYQENFKRERLRCWVDHK